MRILFLLLPLLYVGCAGTAPKQADPCVAGCEEAWEDCREKALGKLEHCRSVRLSAMPCKINHTLDLNACDEALDACKASCNQPAR